MSRILSKFNFGDMTFIYTNKNDTVGLTAVPRDTTVSNEKAYTPLSLAQIKLQGGDGYNALFTMGKTMLNSRCGFTFSHQDASENSIITYLRHEKGYVLEHHLSWQGGDKIVTMQTIFKNGGTEPATIEMLSSFQLGGITPFEAGDAPETLVMHRLRSRWADEGRLESIPIEDLQLEPSITGVSANSIRFGQVGTMPVREYFPFMVIEDTKHKICWGAQLAWPGSWQMEAYRKDDALNISGGLADREFGHWSKTIHPGDSFATPVAILTVHNGTVDETSQRLTSWQYKAWQVQAESEKTVPAIFNEWCMSWGGLNAKTVASAAKKLKDTGIKYFVMDAGWYDKHGDWNLNHDRFPGGINKTTEYVKSMGIIPGLWFEYECCEKDSEFYKQEKNMLHLDGNVIADYNRHFIDMRSAKNRKRLHEKTVSFLKENGFGYLKIDYNATIGIGCDGAESPGEGLRQHIQSMVEFLQDIRKEWPDLIIENCSSGGHRLEPCMMGLTAMSSFSDAHESINIPIIAANLHRAILPCQSQVWAVLRKEDTVRRLYYTMTAGLLGRLCLSGNVDEINDSQWGIVKNGLAFYEKIGPVLKNGHTTWYGSKIKSYRHPKGWQGVLRTGENEAYLVVHTFGEPKDVCIELPKQFKVADMYMEDKNSVVFDKNHVVITSPEEFQGFAIRLIRDCSH